MAIKSQEALPLLSVDVVPQDASKPPKQRQLFSVPARIQGVVLVATSCVLFSLQSVLVKYASYSMPSKETVFWRSFVAWALALVTIQVGGLSLRVEREFWGPLAARCAFGSFGLLLSYYAMQQMVLSDAATLLDTNSVLTFLMGSLLVKERVDPVTLGYALFSFVGVICVARPAFIFGKPAGGRENSTFAVLCCLTAATTGAIAHVCVRRMQQANVVVVCHYLTLASALAALIPLLIEGGFVIDFAPLTWLAVLSMGVLAFGGQLLLTRGFQLEKAGVAAAMVNINVALVFVWDVALLHEQINPWSVVGAVIICSGAAMIVLRLQK